MRTPSSLDADEVDEVTGAYASSGVLRDQFGVTVPCRVDIDLTQVELWGSNRARSRRGWQRRASTPV